MSAPAIPGKAEVGTAARNLVQETNITPVAPGSEKVIRSAPGVESASLPGMVANQVPIVAGMGLPPGGAPAPGAMRSNAAPGQNNQPMFQGGAPAPASAPGQAGRQATVASSSGIGMGSVATSRANRAAEAERVAQEAAQVQGQRSPTYSVGSFFPGIGSLGGRVSAGGDENVTIPKNFGQAVVASLSKPGSKGEAWATNPKVTNSGVGSISKPGATIKAIANSPAAQNISSALRSVVQQVQNTFNNLRSKFKLW